MSDALFHIDGDAFVPSDLTRGPWSDDMQHGGPPAALLARAIEAVDAPVPMHVARLSFDLLRPVPLEPLRVRTEVLRTGKRIQLVAASLHAGDTEVVRAVGLRMRAADVAAPEELIDGGSPDLPDAPTGGGVPRDLDPTKRYFHLHGVEIRNVTGFDRPGPATAWLRLQQPLVAGEEPSGAVRVVATADFGNGLSWVLPDDWLFINADLTVHLLRPPVGEWICLAARTLPSSAGIGMAESAIYDRDGRVGRGIQSLLLDDAR